MARRTARGTGAGRAWPRPLGPPSLSSPRPARPSSIEDHQMSWDDRRTVRGVATIARQAAHSDDAKHRPDETSHLRPRARWVVPVAIGVAVLLLGGGAVAVALTAARRRPAAASAGIARTHGLRRTPPPRPPAAPRAARSPDTPSTLTGSMHAVGPGSWHGNPAGRRLHGTSFTFTCQDSSCSGRTCSAQPFVLPAAACLDEYLLVGHEHVPQIRECLGLRCRPSGSPFDDDTARPTWFAGSRREPINKPHELRRTSPHRARSTLDRTDGLHGLDGGSAGARPSRASPPTPRRPRTAR